MSPEVFRQESALREIGDSFISKGWITLTRFIDGLPSELVYCYLVKARHLAKHMKTDDWGVGPGSEGKPSIITTYREGVEKITYHPFSSKEYEPFLFKKYFAHNKTRYIDVSEDFVNYFQLYETVEEKSRRKYYHVDDMGEMTEVLSVWDGVVKVRYKFMMEYLSIRQIHLAVCFDFMAISKGTLKEMGAGVRDERIVSQDRHYTHRTKVDPYDPGEPLQNWIRGKVIIRYEQQKTERTWLDVENQYEEFIIGVDKLGEPISKDCSRENPSLAVAYFKRTVLDKYYNEPETYTVDGFSVSSSQFTLKIDNNCEDYVPVLVDYLGHLPHREQLYWKQYNIAPEGFSISPVYYTVMIKGEFPEGPLMADLIFKEKYESFNQQWLKKYEWPLFKPLSGIDVHLFRSLHLPSTDNVKAFSEQMLALYKMIIDALNGKELTRNLSNVPGEGSIARLGRYMELHGQGFTDLFIFLKHFQNLRSGMFAHHNKKEDKKVDAAFLYFGFKKGNYRAVARTIFSLATLAVDQLAGAFLDEQI